MNITSAAFLSTLLWIDGTPLQIEPYRQNIFSEVLDRYRDDGVPYYNFALAGRGKKNHKSTDLILAGLFVLMCRESPQGSDALIIANDETQAGQDLDLAKKLVRVNGLDGDDGELEILDKEIRRRDGNGSMQIVPAKNVVGQHGRTAAFIGFDEIWAYTTHALFEAFAPDPTRYCLTWVTSYDSINDSEGFPLHDYKKAGMEGTDPRMFFSWYSGDYCTDPAFANLPPEERANPSMGTWPEGRDYLVQQRRRLPSAKFRRLHLNLPGAPDGAHFDQATVEFAIVAGRTAIDPQDGVDYLSFVDMSGGSNDDATLGIAHWDGEKAVLDLLVSQGDAPPFNPRLAVARFAVLCKRYRCREVHGDAYAGLTFRHDFADCKIDYVVEKRTRTDLYEDLEVALNAGQVELLDLAKLRREILGIVRRGASLDHMSGNFHDDWATSAAGALVLVNPDIGNTTPGILDFYRRQSEAATAAQQSLPTLKQEHGHQAVLQIGTRRPANFVKVIVPASCASDTIMSAGGTFLVETEGDQRVVWMPPDAAIVAITSPMSLHWFEANGELRATLQQPKQSQGVKVTDWMAWQQSMRPRSPLDRGGYVMDALKAAGRWR